VSEPVWSDKLACCGRLEKNAVLPPRINIYSFSFSLRLSKDRLNMEQIIIMVTIHSDVKMLTQVLLAAVF